MTYTKNTWANGDVITAAKLNNMEDGIANAGSGSGQPWATVTTAGFGNEYEFAAAGLFYVKEVESGQYAGRLVATTGGSLLSTDIQTVGNKTLYFSIQLPPVNDVQFVFWVNENEADVTCSFSGNISTTPVTVRWEPESSQTYAGYVITGDCSITITAN